MRRIDGNYASVHSVSALRLQSAARLLGQRGQLSLAAPSGRIKGAKEKCLWIHICAIAIQSNYAI